MTRLLPRILVERGGGRGLHRGCVATGWLLSFAWLGLYCEIVLGMERWA